MKVTEQLLEECKKGDRRAQKRLYELCFRPMLSVCFRYADCKDDAVDLLNMAFLKVITHLDKFRPPTPFEAWVKRITINTVIDEFRKQKKERELFYQGDFDQVEITARDVNEAELKLDAEGLYNMVNQLPNVTRNVFNLFAIDGYSHKEIAEQLKISEGTSKWHVNFARNKLKEMLKSTIKTVKTMLL